MAVANYEGNSIALFERASDQWQFRCKQPVVASHGVAFAGEAVFASGQTLAKFDVKSGAELARVDKLAGDPIQFATLRRTHI